MLWRLWFLAAVASAELFRVPLKKLANKRWELGLANSLTLGFDGPGARNTFDLGVDDWKNVDYYGTIQLGTPAQTETMVLDTGSAISWVPSASQYRWQHHNIYNPVASTSFKDVHLNTTLTYGIGKVFVELSQDTVDIANIKFPNFPFGRVTSGNITPISNYASSPIDGLLGLSFKSSVVEEFLMRDAGRLSEPVFGFYIGTERHPGELVFGGVDPQHVAGGFTFAPLISSTHWMVSLDRMSVGGHPVASVKGAVIDSGTTLVAGPRSTMNAIAEQLQSATGCQSAIFLNNGLMALIFPCARDFPDVTFTLGGVNFALKAEDYTHSYITSKNAMVLQFQVLDAAFVDFLLLGDTFMRQYYCQFDFGRKRIGFAPAAVSSSSNTIIV